jgi:uncharacterized protein YoxC
MSAKSTASTPASVPKVEVKAKKPRTPTLPAKFGKFIQFGYWFMQKLNEDPDAPAVDESLFIEKINLFSDVETQQSFVQQFFDESKDVNKTIRQLIKDRTKDATKAAKAAAREQAKSDKKSQKTTEPKEKKPRAKKDKPTASSEDAFVNEIVQLANGVTQSSPVNATKPKLQKPTKDAKPKLDKPTKDAKPYLDKPTKDAKPKLEKPKNTKTKANTNHTPSQLNTEVSVLNLNDQQFLIDDHLNVYHFQNHSFIGIFDPNLNAII